MPHRLSSSHARTIGLLAAAGLLFGAAAMVRGDDCPRPASPAPKDAPGPAAKEAPPSGGADVGQMHNVRQVTPRFVRGSAPEVESDFELLAKMGVKVVVSVDGATPDVASAHKHGLTYVHIPFGYDGVPRAQLVLLYKAFTTLGGPFYVHCHRGRHRGPAACGIGLMGVEGWTAEQVVAEMKRAGTAPKYDGLYAVPAKFVKPTEAELAAAPNEFPESTPAAPFTQVMVGLDGTFDRLTTVRNAKWTSPADHPDVDPRHEAVILAEAFRELARRDEVAKRPAEFQKRLAGAEAAAWELSQALEGTADAAAASRADAAFARVEQSCTACHTTYRDPSSRPH